MTTNMDKKHGPSHFLAATAAATAAAPGALLVAEGLCKAYGCRTVLRNVSLTLPPGALALICGPNGAGKSTLLRILAGLAAPDAGNICLAAAPGEIAFMTHESCAYPGLTALQNLAFWTRLHGLDLSDDDLRGLLAEAGLAEFAHEPAADFSQGMLQRLNLARCFAPRPRLVFLDEPATGLDRAGGALLKAHIARTRQAGGAVALVSHQVSEFTPLADMVLSLGWPECGKTDSNVVYCGPAAGFASPDREVGHV